MMFGRRSTKTETLSKAGRYASTPLETPGYLYTNRREDEVDADGDLDDLIKQEIQRYEELFHSNNGLPATYGDDDTLQDGSIYTSMQASAVMLPPMNRATSQEDEDTMWGLPNPPMQPKLKPASATSLLKPEETAAAQACNNTNPRSGRKLFVPPVPVLSVDDPKFVKEVPAKAKKAGTPATPMPCKKKAFKPFSKRFLGKSNTNVSTRTPVVPSTPATRASEPTPRTRASTVTPATPKTKFFLSVKFLKSSKSKQAPAQQQQHQNLLLASMAAAAGPSKRAPSPAFSASKPASDKRIVQSRNAPFPPHPPSPPPPMDHCEIRFNDGASVNSALTDALDAWMTNGSPPKIIGGNHLSQDISPYKFEVYEGLPPNHGTSNEDLEQQDEESTESNGALLLTEDGLFFHNHHGKALSSAKAPASVSSGLDSGNVQDNLVQMVWANKEQQELLKQTKALTLEDVNPGDAAMHVVQILGLQGSNAGLDERSQNVKRDLFGANGEGFDTDVSLAPLGQVVCPYEDEVEECDEEPLLPADDVQEDHQDQPVDDHHQRRKPSKFKRFLRKLVTDSKTKQLQQEATARKLREQERAKAYEAEMERLRLEKEETKRIQQKRQQELERQRKLELGSQSPVSHTSNTESATQSATQSATLSDEDCAPPLSARSFSLMTGQQQESATLSDNNSPRSARSARSFSLLTGQQQESETSSDNHSPRSERSARSFSLMSGQMKAADQPGPASLSQESFATAITSHPTLQTAPSSNPSLSDSPKPTTFPEEEMMLNTTLNSSYLVNFQFRREDGEKSYSMAYAVDSASSDRLTWKDIVNEAWKQDRKVVKSGVFSAIQAANIVEIQQGNMEMRFELPFWGKHASQTMGEKSLDLVLDVVGPERPVQVIITLEEPQVATGVDDDAAPECLF